MALALQVGHSSRVLSTLPLLARRGPPSLPTCFTHGPPPEAPWGSGPASHLPVPLVCYICTPRVTSPVWRRKGAGSAGTRWPPWAARCLAKPCTCFLVSPGPGLFFLAPEVRALIKLVGLVAGCCTPIPGVGVRAGKGRPPRRLAAGTRSFKGLVGRLPVHPEAVDAGVLGMAPVG